MASLADIRAGLKTAFETVSGIGPVLKYPIKQPGANFTLDMRRLGFEDASHGTVFGARWEFGVQLYVYWQDAEEGEKDLDKLTLAIIQAIRNDRMLGGVITSGGATITSGTDAWIEFDTNNVTYRTTLFTVSVLDKG